MTERATPFYCPYCGDEDLRPHEDGAWLCGSCRRVFTVKMLGLNFPGDQAPTGAASPSNGVER